LADDAFTDDDLPRRFCEVELGPWSLGDETVSDTGTGTAEADELVRAWESVMDGGEEDEQDSERAREGDGDT
jgi:hypothetical protein